MTVLFLLAVATVILFVKWPPTPEQKLAREVAAETRPDPKVEIDSVLKKYQEANCISAAGDPVPCSERPDAPKATNASGYTRSKSVRYVGNGLVEAAKGPDGKAYLLVEHARILRLNDSKGVKPLSPLKEGNLAILPDPGRVEPNAELIVTWTDRDLPERIPIGDQPGAVLGNAARIGFFAN